MGLVSPAPAICDISRATLYVTGCGAAQAALWRASAPTQPGAHRVGVPGTAAHDRAAYCTRPDAYAGRGMAPLARRRSARSGPGRRARTWVPAGSSSSPVSSVPSVAPTEYTSVARLSAHGLPSRILASGAAKPSVPLRARPPHMGEAPPAAAQREAPRAASGSRAPTRRGAAAAAPLRQQVRPTALGHAVHRTACGRGSTDRPFERTAQAIPRTRHACELPRRPRQQPDPSSQLAVLQESRRCAESLRLAPCCTRARWCQGTGASQATRRRALRKPGKPSSAGSPGGRRATRRRQPEQAG